VQDISGHSDRGHPRLSERIVEELDPDRACVSEPEVLDLDLSSSPPSLNRL
jgi:hypothetical protein